MSKNQLETLKTRLFSKGNKTKKTAITDIVDLIRELGCLDAVIGKESEVRDPDGKLIYVIKQKPIKVIQLNTLMEEVNRLRKIENEEQKEAMEKSKGRGRRK